MALYICCIDLGVRYEVVVDDYVFIMVSEEGGQPCSYSARLQRLQLELHIHGVDTGGLSMAVDTQRAAL